MREIASSIRKKPLLCGKIFVRERFSHENITKIYQLRRAIIQLQEEQLSSVTAYFTRLKSLWDELSTYIVVPRPSMLMWLVEGTH